MKLLSSSYTLPIAISVVAHAVLLAVVTWGWQASSATQRVYKPKYVEAKLVTLKPKTNRKKSAKPKPKKIDLTAKRRAQEKKAREAAEKKRRQAQEKAAREKVLKEKREKERREQERREKERLAKEKARQEELQQRRLEEQRRQQEMEAQFADALEDEEEFLQAEDDEAKAQSYVALISSRIEQNWSRPPSARRGMTCELQLQLVPTGKVVNVTVVRSSGNSAFDRSAEQAVKKAEQFPELKGMPPQVFERYFRQLRLVFNPTDLRL